MDKIINKDASTDVTPSTTSTSTVTLCATRGATSVELRDLPPAAKAIQPRAVGDGELVKHTPSDGSATRRLVCIYANYLDYNAEQEEDVPSKLKRPEKPNFGLQTLSEYSPAVPTIVSDKTHNACVSNAIPQKIEWDELLTGFPDYQAIQEADAPPKLNSPKKLDFGPQTDLKIVSSVQPIVAAKTHTAGIRKASFGLQNEGKRNPDIFDSLNELELLERALASYDENKCKELEANEPNFGPHRPSESSPAVHQTIVSSKRHTACTSSASPQKEDKGKSDIFDSVNEPVLLDCALASYVENRLEEPAADDSSPVSQLDSNSFTSSVQSPSVNLSTPSLNDSKSCESSQYSDTCTSTALNESETMSECSFAELPDVSDEAHNGSISNASTHNEGRRTPDVDDDESRFNVSSNSDPCSPSASNEQVFNNFPKEISQTAGLHIIPVKQSCPRRSYLESQAAYSTSLPTVQPIISANTDKACIGNVPSQYKDQGQSSNIKCMFESQNERVLVERAMAAYNGKRFEELYKIIESTQ